MTYLTPNHPAVEAANMGVQGWLAGDGPFDDDPVRLAHDMTAVCITAALPHLTADDLRNTPAGKQLMAEGWEEGAQDAWEITGERWNSEYAGEPGDLSSFRVQNPIFPNPYREGDA